MGVPLQKMNDLLRTRNILILLFILLVLSFIFFTSRSHDSFTLPQSFVSCTGRGFFLSFLNDNYRLFLGDGLYEQISQERENHSFFRTLITRHAEYAEEMAQPISLITFPSFTLPLPPQSHPEGVFRYTLTVPRRGMIDSYLLVYPSFEDAERVYTALLEYIHYFPSSPSIKERTLTIGVENISLNGVYHLSTPPDAFLASFFVQQNNTSSAETLFVYHHLDSILIVWENITPYPTISFNLRKLTRYSLAYSPRAVRRAHS